jgi:hypothetical protein
MKKRWILGALIVVGCFLLPTGCKSEGSPPGGVEYSESRVRSLELKQVIVVRNESSDDAVHLREED